MTVDRRQVLTGTTAALALPAVPSTAAVAATICQRLADSGGPTVTSLLADYWRTRAECEAVSALLKDTPDEPPALAAEADRLCDAFLAIEPEICKTPPRDVREAVALVAFIRRNVMSDPDADDEEMTTYVDARDFVALDNALVVLERAVR